MTSDVLFLFYPTNKIYYNKIRLTKTHFLLQKRLPIDTKQMPVLFFKTPLTPKIKKPGQTVICFTNWWIFLKYLPNLMSKFTGFYTNWYFIDIRTVAKHDKVFYICKRIFRRKPRLFSGYSLNFFYNCFIQLTLFKNPIGLINLIQQRLLQSRLRYHKRVFFNLKRFLKLWYSIFIGLSQVKGYTFFFKGKLGKKGSVRKRIFFCKRGKVSFTNKQLRVTIRTYYIWTITGVIGAGINIFY